jgi:hypothetical protein
MFGAQFAPIPTWMAGNTQQREGYYLKGWPDF